MSNSHQRFLDLDEQTRAVWLDPAETEFFKKGFAEASLNRILQVASQSKGRFYHYFDDKASLFRAVLERRLELIENVPLVAVESAHEPQMFWAGIKGLGQNVSAALREDPALAALMRTIHRETAARQAAEIPYRALQSALSRLLEVGQKIGAVRDDLPVGFQCDIALDLIASVDRWFSEHAGEMSEEDEKSLSETALEMIIAPFLSAKATEGP